MKICPKCFKSNPDNSKKCFFCHEDIRDVMPYVEEVVIPEEEDPENEIFEEDIEPIVETENELQTKKRIQIHLPNSINVCKFLLPVFALIVFLLSIFLSVFLIVIYIKSSAPLKTTVFYPILTFILGTGFSLFLLWLKALLIIFENKKENNENTTQNQ